MRAFISAFAFLIIFTGTTFASVKFNVTTDRNNVSLGEQLIITAKVVSTKKIKNLQIPQVPSSDKFKVLKTSQNQSSSTSIQIMNGKTKRTVETTYLFYYFITPLKKESFTFPSLSFKGNDKEYKSSPFTINVGVAAAKKKEISIYLDVKKLNLYKGEQTSLTVKVIQPNSNNFSIPNESYHEIIKNINTAFGDNFSTNLLYNSLDQSAQVINGKQMVVNKLHYSIVPLKEGKHTIQSVPLEYHELRQVQSRSRSRDPFDNFFGGSIFGSSIQRIPATVFSPKKTITVKSLPKNAPKSFTGAVGKFKLKTKLSSNSVPAGESVTLKIDISGNTRPGNISDIELKKSKLFEIYTPEKHTYIDTTKSGIFTRKTFKYLIIPEEEGEHTLPKIEWTYFDVKSGKYKTLTGGEQKITVSKGSTKKDKGHSRYLTHEEIREVGRDIRYIKTTSKLANESFRPYASPLFLLTFPIPFIIAIFSFLYRIQGAIINKNPENRLKKRAYSVALKEINHTRSNIKEDETIASLAKILERYISNRFNISATGSTLTDLKNELTKNVTDISIINKLIPFIEKLDGFRFSGMKSDHSAISKTVDELESIVKELNSKEVKK